MVTLWEFLASGGEALPQFLSFLVAITIGLTVHEFAHAKAAQMAGDPTAEAAGRVTLNPLAHFDPIGTTFLLLFGFGWGKPVPVNHMLFRKPRLHSVLVSLWGPLSNIIVAFVAAVPLQLMIAGDYAMVLEAIVLMNLILALFNLMPVYPLDGSHILIGVLPLQAARKVEMFYERFGIFALMLLIVTHITRYIVLVPVLIIYSVLTTPIFG